MSWLRPPERSFPCRSKCFPGDAHGLPGDARWLDAATVTARLVRVAALVPGPTAHHRAGLARCCGRQRFARSGGQRQDDYCRAQDAPESAPRLYHGETSLSPDPAGNCCAPSRREGLPPLGGLLPSTVVYLFGLQCIGAVPTRNARPLDARECRGIAIVGGASCIVARVRRLPAIRYLPV